MTTGNKSFAPAKRKRLKTSSAQTPGQQQLKGSGGGLAPTEIRLSLPKRNSPAADEEME